jgi:hypothetical protein
MGVALTFFLDMPDCNNEIFEPVCIITLLVTPSISTLMEGVPWSNRTGTKVVVTAFSGVLRWRELPSLTPRSRFPDFLFFLETLSSHRRGLIAGMS